MKSIINAAFYLPSSDCHTPALQFCIEVARKKQIFLSQFSLGLVLPSLFLELVICEDETLRIAIRRGVAPRLDKPGPPFGPRCLLTRQR